MQTHYVTLSPSLLDLLGAVVPLLVAVLARVSTTANLSSAIKGLANLVLSAVVGAVAALVQANGHVAIDQWLFHIITAFVVSTTTYVTVHRATGLTAKIAGPPRTGAGDLVLPGDPPAKARGPAKRASRTRAPRR
jgi:glucan phosphoethanolaminetransferase (alkaline phosphatase superfamily)